MSMRAPGMCGMLSIINLSTHQLAFTNTIYKCLFSLHNRPSFTVVVLLACHFFLMMTSFIPISDNAKSLKLKLKLKSVIAK